MGSAQVSFDVDSINRIGIEDRIKLFSLIIRFSFGLDFLNELNVAEEIRPGEKKGHFDYFGHTKLKLNS